MINGPVWDESQLSKENAWPTILAIGDSWFWYPFNNLLNPLHRMVNERAENVILVRGHNGAEAVEYVTDALLRRTLLQDIDKQRGYGRNLRAVLVSGGGNDFAGYDDLGGLLRDDCRTATTPAECFQPGQPDALFDKVAQAIGELAGLIEAELGSAVPVLVHTYDYPLPTGKGFLGNAQWLKAPMDAHHVPTALQAKLLKLAIDTYFNTLQAVAALHKNLVLVDTRGALDTDDWANELHPTMAGFNKIAQAWRPTLEKMGLV